MSDMREKRVELMIPIAAQTITRIIIVFNRQACNL